MTVELKEFVERTLTDIIRGVRDASHDPTIGPHVAPWGIGPQNSRLKVGR
jgi:thiamine biosynthesis lipoprotein ApbE